MSEKKTVNEYLFYEFGYDLRHDPSAITDDWPFELQTSGTIRSTKGEIEVLEFVANGETYFVLHGNTLSFYPAAGMTLEDLRVQQEGAVWITRQDPIDLATSRLGDDTVPPVAERQTALESLANIACASPRIFEGLYLRMVGAYLALVEDTTTGTEFIIGSDFEPRAVGFPQASSWRRLAIGVGKMLEDGTLEQVSKDIE
jgi:hypothetical protein